MKKKIIVPRTLFEMDGCLFRRWHNKDYSKELIASPYIVVGRFQNVFDFCAYDKVKLYFDLAVRPCSIG